MHKLEAPRGCRQKSTSAHLSALNLFGILLIALQQSILQCLTAWMKLLMHFFESRLINMCVNLRRGDAAMAEHFLDLS